MSTVRPHRMQVAAGVQGRFALSAAAVAKGWIDVETGEKIGCNPGPGPSV